MPEATTKGANTMRCYINGEPWVAYKGRPGLISSGGGKIDLDYELDNSINVNIFK